MANKISVKVTKLAFYNGCLVYPNEIIKNFKGKIPSWATLVDGENKKDCHTDKLALNDEQPKEQDKKNEPEKNNEPKEQDENKEPDDAKLQEELDELLNEAIEKDILIDDADKKTVQEQIAELKKLLGKE